MGLGSFQIILSVPNISYYLSNTTSVSKLKDFDIGIHGIYENNRYSDNPIQDSYSSILLVTKDEANHKCYIICKIQGGTGMFVSYMNEPWMRVV